MHVDEMKPADLSYPILKELCYTNKRDIYNIKSFGRKGICF